ncbi:MAG: LytR family transcriptional regulator [Nitriliruptor sp.]|nr:MAG: LytR family transcriptional regulator [Nitriliruptor sp.]
MSRGELGPWGPVVEKGRSRRAFRRLAALLGVGGLLTIAAVGTTTQLLVQQVETNLSRVPVPELEEPVERSDARYFLLVGSDARDGLDADDRRDLTLGSFEGQRSDVVMYLAISADREQVSLVSLPRDLLVELDGRNQKLTDTFAGGPDQLIRVLRDNFQLPVNHYAAVTLGGFVDVVRTLGSVEICLEEPLRDRKAGADFEAGCHDMDATEALAFVRSRQGARADLERIDRQQTFLRAVLRDLTATRTLANARQVYRLTEDVASELTTDDRLQTAQMLGLADEMRTVISAGMPMTAVPAYPRRIDGLDYMVAYGPGARALFDDLRAGRQVADRGTREERDETVIGIASVGQGAGILDSTLRFAGFQTRVGARVGPTEELGAVTTVFVVPGEEERADWVAATLGAPTLPLPEDVTVPDGVHVLVASGDDATT